MRNISITPAAATVLIAEGNLGETPQLHPPPLLQLPLTPSFGASPAPAATQLTCHPPPPPWPHGFRPSSPLPTGTHEGRVHLLGDKFPTLFLVVNCFDPLRYLALGCLSCSQVLWLCGPGHFPSERERNRYRWSISLFCQAVMGIIPRETA